jgi:hypothetical protein
MIDHVRTLWWMSRRRECWFSRIYWRDWRWSITYDWYDGPIYQVWLGPLVIALDCVRLKPETTT